MAKHTEDELRQLQALPLDIKISMTCSRIRAWIREYGQDGVYISFSGGKDSTVLLDLVRNKCGYKNVRAMFIDVPTQYPELRAFAQTFENVDIIKPKISFIEVCEKYGFPLISKEVAECVEGARKYLTSLYECEKILIDRQTDRHYSYYFRKLTGIGEYSKRKDEEEKRRSEFETRSGAGMANDRQPNQGQYPWQGQEYFFTRKI